MTTTRIFGNFMSPGVPPTPASEERHLEGNFRIIKHAKLQGEEAAMLAASEISYSQSIWSQLTIQKSSGMGLDGEVNLTSAAVAVAAASSVVKAAAAVSKVASYAALQAKLMVDESLITINSDSSAQSSRTASAFRKPENLDAILKAAKLVAEAVSEAVKIMAMGEPIRSKLAELVEAGSNGYWEGQHISSELLSEMTNVTEAERDSIAEAERVDMSGDHMNVQSSFEKETEGHDQVKTSQETTIRGGSLVEGDTPQRKRAKLAIHDAESDPAIEARDAMKHKCNVGSLKPEVWRPQALSAKEKPLTFWMNTREEIFSTNSNKGTGPQKEGAEIVFGVPNPGKSTEFVELSKHSFAGNSYSENTRLRVPNSNGLNNVSKVDTKRKRVVEYKPMENGIEAHQISEGNLSVNSNDGMVHHLRNVKTSVTQKENVSENTSLQETFTLLNAPSKRNTSSSVEADVVTKGKVAFSGEKLAKNEVKESVSDASEPRRSNRKMQPTSRLLEGLETSFTSRMPSVTHEKGTKTRCWSKSSRGNNRAENGDR